MRQSLDGKTAVVAQQIAEFNVGLVHHRIFSVRDLDHPRSSPQFTVVESLVDIGGDEQPLRFLSVVTDEVCDDEETKEGDGYDGVGGAGGAHPAHGCY